MSTARALAGYALAVFAAYGCGEPTGHAPAGGGAAGGGAGSASAGYGGAAGSPSSSGGVGAEAGAGIAGSSNGASGAAGNSGGGGGADLVIASSPFAKLVTEQVFELMFPRGSSLYTYADFVHATVSYPDFASDGSDGAKREAAAFLANVARESIELQYTDEIIQGPYCQPADDCPCADGKSYFGRGALQISWNYNYCAAGKDLGLPLLANPEMVSSDPKLRWLTGLWFWMTQTSGTGHTPHSAIASDGFGETIRIINGGIECNGPTDPEVQANVADRKNHYLKFIAILGVGAGGPIDC